MKILFITNNLPPIVDGVGDYTYNIAMQFAEHNHEVYVVCKRNSKIDTDVKGITILPIVDKWNNSCHEPIIKLIKEKCIDVVSLQYVPHGFQSKGIPFNMIPLVKAIKRSNVEFMIFCHEVYIPFVSGSIKLYINSVLSKLATKMILYNCQKIATSIDFYRQMIEKLNLHKCLSKPIPIVSNVPIFEGKSETLHSIKKEIGATDRIVISFWGMRNVESSVKAIKNLINRGIKIKVLFIGNTKGDISILDKDDYYKTGILPIFEIDKYIQISDILVLPETNIYGCSFKSGSLAAALRDGRCVVTAKGLLTSSELRNGENVVFTDFEAPAIIEHCLEDLIVNPNKRKDIGHAAACLAKSFTWKHTYMEYMNFLYN